MGRFVAVVAMLGIAATSVVAATSSPVAGKIHQTALPQYVKGYWPSDDPRLCIWDVTNDDYPVAEALARYDEVAGIEMHLTTSVVGCLPSEPIVGVVAYDGDLPCGDYDGCWVPDGDSALDADGLLVHASGSYIALDSRMSNKLTEDHWVALIAHEIGHALGLAHTNRRDSAMRQEDVQIKTVTATDIAVLNDLYSDR